MARKVVNRKELRAEAEAAETAEATTKKKVAKKKATSARPSRSKAVADVRMKLFWGVFNQSLKRVAVFDFDQKKEAEKKADELSKSGKSPHFVQRVKEVIEEE
jgi:hypothetical protein